MVRFTLCCLLLSLLGGSLVFAADVAGGPRNPHTYCRIEDTGKFLFQVLPPDKLRHSFTSAKLAFNAAGNAFILCGETKRILKYNVDGVLVQDYTNILHEMTPNKTRPYALGIDQQGNLYVGWQTFHSGPVWMIDVFDGAGKLLRTINGVTK